MLTPRAAGRSSRISETDARELGIEDNDWIEAFNANALTARAVVSQRVPPGNDHDVPRAHQRTFPDPEVTVASIQLGDPFLPRNPPIRIGGGYAQYLRL